jgi:methyl coenzyme M reductase subunit C-like uncharacterized protein (methanogenesis marker protein 7)
LVRQETSKVIIEPQTRVVEALRLALAQIGPDDFLIRAKATPAILEKWVNGQEWIPLHVVGEACKINRRNREAPAYTKTLSECTSGVRFRIRAGEEVEKLREAVVEGITSIQDQSLTKGPEERAATPAKPKAPHNIVSIAVVLFIVPLMGGAFGFLFGGPMRAAVATISCYAIVVALTLVFFTFSTKRSRSL